jgi:beta-glucosidase
VLIVDLSILDQGEDTHLAAELGRAAIDGFTNGKQFNSSSAVAPLMKHYVAYSAPEGGHNTAPAHVGRREVLTTFVPPFSAGMEAGAQAVMVSYNEIDGEPNAQSKYLLTSIPRSQVGGNGPSGSSWYAPIVTPVVHFAHHDGEV